MKTLVVYDSVFSNTKKIAQAIGVAAGCDLDTEVLRASAADVKHLKGVGLLVVGSPTRAFKPTKTITDFVKSIPKGSLKNVKVASFDTRMDVADVGSGMLKKLMNTFGYAAENISSALVKKGGDLICPPEGFFVIDSEGPLKQGETERAEKWAGELQSSGGR